MVPSTGFAPIQTTSKDVVLLLHYEGIDKRFMLNRVYVFDDKSQTILSPLEGYFNILPTSSSIMVELSSNALEIYIANVTLPLGKP